MQNVQCLQSSAQLWQNITSIFSFALFLVKFQAEKLSLAIAEFSAKATNKLLFGPKLDRVGPFDNRPSPD